jgi:hypothetical protein
MKRKYTDETETETGVKKLHFNDETHSPCKLLDLVSAIDHIESAARNVKLSSSSPYSIKQLLSAPSPCNNDDKLAKTCSGTLETDARHHILNALSTPQSWKKLSFYYVTSAQKCYGKEKRFLCPPPVASLTLLEGSHQGQPTTLLGEKPQASLLVDSIEGSMPVQYSTSFEHDAPALFKNVHVNGLTKTKHFQLKLKVTMTGSIHKVG